MSKQAIHLAILAVRSGAEYVAECKRLKDAGELDRRFIVYGMEGASEYVNAIASGDIAGTSDIDARAAKCAACPSRVPHVRKPERGYCGKAFRDARDMDPPTCGCPIDAMILVASKVCPQKRWGAVTRIS